MITTTSKLSVAFLLGVFLFSCQSQNKKLQVATPHQAPFVWIDEEGKGRQTYAYFRLDFELSESPEEALINLFADSRYHLYVNGSMINFGPARAYPWNPEYDTHDIKSYLSKGKNFIVVKAMNNGVYTYQIRKHIGGFVAWGDVKSASENIDLGTPGNWLCIQENGYDPRSQKMSFATGPLESFDGRKSVKGWNDVDADLTTWKPVSIIKDQESWGPLRARTIPHLTQDEIPAKELTGIYSLKDDEDIFSFKLTGPDTNKKEFRSNPWAFAYTYVYSPKAQKIKTGVWWGEFWVNGEGPINGKSEGKPNRQEIVLDLKEGWNYFFVKYGIYLAVWDFYMAVPKGTGIDLSPTKELGSENIFMVAGTFPDKEDSLIKTLPLPFEGPESLPTTLSKTWEPRKRGETAGNPAWEMAWRYFDEAKPFASNQTENIEITDSTGTALIFDIGGKQLGRIFIEYEAEEGTTFDIGFTESLNNGKPWVLKRNNFNNAVRHVAGNGMNRFETFKPYGCRFLQVDVTGNKRPVKIKKVGVVSQVYPFTFQAKFQCSNEMLNKIWALGPRTLRVCAEDAYVDTPYRERGFYAGDALAEYAISTAVDGDDRLIRRCLNIVQDMYKDRFYPGEKERDEDEVDLLEDYPFLSLIYFNWYYDRRNDTDALNELYTPYTQMFDFVWGGKAKNNLVETKLVFLEWTKIPHRDYTSTAFNALLHHCSLILADMAKDLGKSEDVAKYTDIAATIKEAINNQLWDEKIGAYRDGIKDGKLLESYYPLTSAWCSIYGISDTEKETRLSPFYESKLRDIGDEPRNRLSSPYGGFYVLAALYKEGRAKIAEDFILKYWSPMVLRHNDTAWENFSDDDFQGTLSHAWSASPTYHISSEILGVKMGFPYPTPQDTVEISPQSASVDWAKGEVPHPKGMIKVDWKIEGNDLKVNCETPEGLAYKVIPRGRLAEKTLWVNGKKM